MSNAPVHLRYVIISLFHAAVSKSLRNWEQKIFCVFPCPQACVLKARRPRGTDLCGAETAVPAAALVFSPKLPCTAADPPYQFAPPCTWEVGRLSERPASGLTPLPAVKERGNRVSEGAKRRSLIASGWPGGPQGKHSAVFKSQNMQKTALRRGSESDFEM